MLSGNINFGYTWFVMMIMDRIGRKGGCVEDGGDFEENGTFVIVI